MKHFTDAFQEAVNTGSGLTYYTRKGLRQFYQKVQSSMESPKTTKEAYNEVKRMEHELDRENSRQLVEYHMNRERSRREVAANLPEGESMNLVPFVLDNPTFAKHVGMLLKDWDCVKGGLKGRVSILHASQHGPRPGPNQLKKLVDEHKMDPRPRLYGGLFVNEKNGPYYEPSIFGTTCYLLLLLFIELNHDRRWLSFFLDAEEDTRTPIYVYVILPTNEKYDSFAACTVGGIPAKDYAKTEEVSVVPDICYEAKRTPNGHVIWDTVYHLAPNGDIIWEEP
jgi:hypothetical protein